SQLMAELQSEAPVLSGNCVGHWPLDVVSNWHVDQTATANFAPTGTPVYSSDEPAELAATGIDIAGAGAFGWSGAATLNLGSSIAGAGAVAMTAAGTLQTASDAVGAGAISWAGAGTLGAGELDV